MPTIISLKQIGFIKGRSIKDCICLTSEAINVLSKKSYGGNFSMKVDIAKSFDTPDWNFLIWVLRTFGFNDLFRKWIHTIFASGKIYILVRGKNRGVFSCTIEVRQGDPLSPLFFFALQKEVISSSITKLVREGKLNLTHSQGRNFILSGDVNKRKMVTVAWHKKKFAL